MNRSKRVPLAKQFLHGGVYEPFANVTTVVNPPMNISTPQNIISVVPPAPRLAPPQPTPPQPTFIENDQNAVKTENELSDDGKPKFKKIFLNRKKSSVRQKEKKLRQNRRLRKAITPKNALMALNELKGVSISDFTITSSTASGGFTAVVTVNNKQYEGTGSSKVAAKNSACEKSLRDIVLEKMRLHPRYNKTQMKSDNAIACDMDIESENSNSCAVDEDDDVPMVNLASFALYKLFSSWESEGFEIPEMHPQQQPASVSINSNGSNDGSVAPPKEPKTTIRTELPANWKTLHPATLLCMMRPGILFLDVPHEGEKTEAMQTVHVTVDEKKYNGSGRSKKIARRNCAVSVCNTLFGTDFEITE